jgi:hypothetical protein
MVVVYFLMIWLLDHNSFHCSLNWFVMMQGDDKKAMLCVQTMRNTLMTTILTATITILVNMALAALNNNAFNASHLFSSGFFGSKSDTIFLLKYGSPSICLLISFLCSSMAIGFLIDANFLMNAYGDFLSGGYTQSVLEKGFTLAFVGNRVFCLAIPLMLWFVCCMSLIMSPNYHRVTNDVPM